ncbi:MAG: glutamate--tRNA ligase [Trueperaceae bacterium]|nr:glutamate--tRNA ligase [Trueperaceae bacterium]
MNVVTRIAPSPTGDPHVGTAYVGLFNYAFAKRHGGRFVFRLEDTDRERYDATSEARILDMFAWLGLPPDEGPGIGGDHRPYRQSERTEIYRAHADRLLREGKAYRAFETPEELEAMRSEQRQQGKALGYDGRGRVVPAEEQERRAAAGEPHVVRLVTPDRGETGFDDLLRGTISIPNEEIRDTVLLKSDGFPTYHFANVVDDQLMGVTHVLRAEEWVTSTPVHVLLYDAFAWAPPVFCHLPLLRNPDANKTKISKRKLDTSVDSYRAQGILPEALRNFLGTLAWSMPDGREFFDLDEMVAAFDPSRISLGGPVFDLRKLRHFNARYLREILPLEEIAARLKPSLEAEGYDWESEDYLLDVVDVLRPRAETLRDLLDAGRYFFDDDFAYDDEARKRVAAAQQILADLERAFSMLDFLDEDAVDDLLDDYVRAREIKKPQVMMPLRAALTGTTQAPSVTDLAAILGRQRVLARIGRALSETTASLPDDHPVQGEEQAEGGEEERPNAPEGRVG